MYLLDPCNIFLSDCPTTNLAPLQFIIHPPAAKFNFKKPSRLDHVTSNFKHISDFPSYLECTTPTRVWPLSASQTYTLTSAHWAPIHWLSWFLKQATFRLNLCFCLCTCLRHTVPRMSRGLLALAYVACLHRVPTGHTPSSSLSSPTRSPRHSLHNTGFYFIHSPCQHLTLLCSFTCLLT